MSFYVNCLILYWFEKPYLSGKSTQLACGTGRRIFMIYIVDNFTPDMLCISTFSLARFEIVSPDTIPTNAFSAISDANMTRVVSGILGFEPNKSDSACISDDYDVLYLARYYGPKLEEGATSLPKGGTITFYKVTTKPEGCRSCPNYGGGDCCTCGWMQS